VISSTVPKHFVHQFNTLVDLLNAIAVVILTAIRTYFTLTTEVSVWVNPHAAHDVVLNIISREILSVQYGKRVLDFGDIVTHYSTGMSSDILNTRRVIIYHARNNNESRPRRCCWGLWMNGV